MDARGVADLQSRARQVRRATLAVALGGVLYGVVVVAVVSQLPPGPPLPWWLIPVALSILAVPVSIAFLGTYHRSLVAATTDAQIDAGLRSIDDLRAELDETVEQHHRDERRREAEYLEEQRRAAERDE